MDKTFYRLSEDIIGKEFVVIADGLMLQGNTIKKGHVFKVTEITRRIRLENPDLEDNELVIITQTKPNREHRFSTITHKVFNQFFDYHFKPLEEMDTSEYIDEALMILKDHKHQVGDGMDVVQQALEKSKNIVEQIPIIKSKIDEILSGFANK